MKKKYKNLKCCDYDFGRLFITMWYCIPYWVYIWCVYN